MMAGPRHGPRPLDVDLLLLGDLELETGRLTLPHLEVEQSSLRPRPAAGAGPRSDPARRHSARRRPGPPRSRPARRPRRLALSRTPSSWRRTRRPVSAARARLGNRRRQVAGKVGDGAAREPAGGPGVDQRPQVLAGEGGAGLPASLVVGGVSSLATGRAGSDLVVDPLASCAGQPRERGAGVSSVGMVEARCGADGGGRRSSPPRRPADPMLRASSRWPSRACGTRAGPPTA